MFRHLNDKALRCPEALHAVFDTRPTFDGDARLCGEGVVAQLNARFPPLPYFVVVTQRKLLLSPLNPAGRTHVAAYSKRKGVVPTRLVATEGAARRSKRVDERPQTAPPRVTVGSPRTARAVDIALARTFDGQRKRAPPQVRRQLKEWPADEVVEIDLSEIAEITVVPFAINRRAAKYSLWRERKNRMPDSLDHYEFQDETIRPWSLRVALTFEKRATIEFATYAKPASIPKELFAAQTVALIRAYLAIAPARPDANPRELSVIQNSSSPDPSRILRKIESMLCVDLRPKSKYALRETQYLLNVEYLDACTGILKDLEARVFIDVDFKRAFFSPPGQRLMRTLLLDFIGNLDDALVVSARRVISSDDDSAEYADVTSETEARAIQVAFVKRSIAALRLFVVALYDARAVKECATFAWIPGTPLDLAQLLMVDRYNYKDKYDYMPFFYRDDIGLDDQAEEELFQKAEVQDHHAEWKHTLEPRCDVYAADLRTGGTKTLPDASCSLTLQRHMAAVLGQDAAFAANNSFHDTSIGATPALNARRSTTSSSSTSALFEAAARLASKKKNNDNASTTSSASSSALFHAAAKLKLKLTPDRKRDEEQPWERNLETLAPPYIAAPVKRRPVSVFVKDEVAPAALADGESTVIRLRRPPPIGEKNCDSHFFCQLLDAQLVFLGRLDDLLLLRSAEATQNSDCCGFVEFIATRASEDQAKELLRVLFERCTGLGLTLSTRERAKKKSNNQDVPATDLDTARNGLFSAPVVFLSITRLLLRMLQGGGLLRAYARTHCELVIDNFLAKGAFYKDLGGCPIIRLASRQLQRATTLVLQTHTDKAFY